MKKTTIYLFLLLFSNTLMAQAYRTAAGLRLGTQIGVSIQQKVTKFGTVEAILQPSFSGDDFTMDILYEHHNRIISKRFNVYVGGGLHKAWRSKESDFYTRANAGVSLILGGEMTISRLNLSWDYKPTIAVWGGKNKFTHHTAVTVRYVILKKKKKKIKWKFWEKD